jgi:type II secretory pathway component PulJ
MASEAGVGLRAARPIPRHARAFSLIEVLAVVLLTSLVIFVTANTYLDVSRATQRAMEGTRSLRQAGAVLDRVARDLEAALLVVKPEERDPNAHPWYFFAQSRYAAEGSDQLKFITQNRALRADDGELRDSKFEVVAYQLVEREDEGEDRPLYDLYRWSSPRLPDGCDLSIPALEDAPLLSDAPGEQPLAERNQLVAERVERFSVRFMREAGDWASSWDSCQLAESSELPIAAEIDIALFDESTTSSVDEFGQAIAEAEAPGYKKRVVLQLRPIDLEARFEPPEKRSGGGSKGDPNDPDAADGGGRPLGTAGNPAREQPDKKISDCVVLPLPTNCQALGESRILGQPFQRGSRHLQALLECGAQVQPACH